MAEITTIARPYAEAVAKLAGEGNTWKDWSAMLALSAGVAVDPQLAALAGNPAVPAERVADLIVAVCAEGLNA